MVFFFYNLKLSLKGYMRAGSECEILCHRLVHNLYSLIIESTSMAQNTPRVDTAKHILQLIQYLTQPHKEEPWTGSRYGEIRKNASMRVWKKREKENEMRGGWVMYTWNLITNSNFCSFLFIYPISSPYPSFLPLLPFLLSNLSTQPLEGDTICYFLRHNYVAIPTSRCRQYLIRAG